MKCVKSSISLPKELHRHAQKRAAAIAKERGSNANVSGYVAELIVKDRQDEVRVPERKAA